MSPEQTKMVNGHKVEEFYWAGNMVVYIDHLATEETFEAAVKRLERASNKE